MVATPVVNGVIAGHGLFVGSPVLFLQSTSSSSGPFPSLVKAKPGSKCFAAYVDIPWFAKIPISSLDLLGSLPPCHS